MENKKLKYIITLQTNKIIKETDKSILYELNDEKQIWLPFQAIRANKLMFWKATVLAYENEKYTYTLIDLKNKKEFKVSLNKLAENVLKNPKAFNVVVEEYKKAETTKSSSDDELVEW